MNIRNHDRAKTRVGWILSLVAGVLLLPVLLAGGALLLLDDDHYRRLLIRGADTFLDVRLEINGDFSLHFGRELTLVAEAVSLNADDDSYSASIGEIRINQRFGSWLRTGTFWINSLVLGDVQLHIRQAKETAFDIHDLNLPPVVIQQARLDNLQLFYTQRDPAVTHEIALLELVVDDVNDSGPIQVSGSGLVNGQPLSVNGRAGALSELVDSGRPYSLELDVTSGELQLRLKGTIADPVRGRGLDIDLAFEDVTLSKTLRLFAEDTPEIGSLSARAHLGGSYAEPRLEDLDLHLARGEELNIQITGDVGNLDTGEGMALQVDGKSSDPAVLSWLLFAKEDKVRSFAVRGSIREDNGRFLASDVEVEGSTRDGLEVSLKGDTQIPTRREPRPDHAQQLALKISAPGIAALNLPEFGDIPEFGHVTGRSNYAPYLDGARITNIRLEAGDRKQLHATVAGSIALIPYELDKGITGIDLDVRLAAASCEQLGEALDTSLPDLGAVRAGMHVSGMSKRLQIDAINVEAGDPEQPTIRVSGTATTGLREHTTTLKITFRVAVADLVAVLRNVKPDYLGQLEGRAELSDVDGSWGLDSFAIASTRTSLYTARFSGALDDVVKRDKAEIYASLDIPDPVALGRALDLDFGGIAAYRTEGVMTFNDKWVTYNGSGQLGRSRSKTSLSGTLVGERPSFRGSLVIPVLYLEDAGIEPGVEPAVAPAGHGTAVKRKQGTSQHVFSREPLDFGLLGRLDLDLEIKIDEIASAQVTADRLYGRVLLENGRLLVRPMQLVAEGGPTDLDLVIDTRGTPSISLQLTADDQKLGHWLAQVQDQVPVDGFANYQIALEATGTSPHALASSLNGEVALAIENARVPRHYIEYLSVDVFGWALGKVDSEARYANIDCLLARFDIKDGIATSRLLAADGPNLSTEGTLTLDLDTETIQAVLLPKQKRTLFSSIAPVRLTGDMRDPEVHAIPAKEAAVKIGSLVLVPYVAIPVTILGKLWQSVDDRDQHGGGCANLQAVKAAEVQKLKNPGVEIPDPASE